MDAPRTPTDAGLVAHDCRADCGVTDSDNQKHGWHREWMTPDGAVAVGMNEDGTVDEILTAGGLKAASLHLEQMDTNEYWVRVGRMVFWITVKKGRLKFVLGEYEA